MTAPNTPRSRQLLILGGVAALSMAVAVSWFVLWHSPADRARETDLWRQRLSAMADDRRFALDQWIRRSLGDARTIAGYPTVRLVLAAPEPTSRPSPRPAPMWHVREVLQTAIREQGYRSAALVSARGALVALVGGSRVGEAGLVSAAQRAVRERSASVEAWRGADGLLGLLFASPAGDRGEPSGAVVLECDPESFLLPLLRNAATATHTGETALARRDSRDAVYISPSKRGGEGLALRRPLDTPRLAMRLALEGEEVFGEFLDYSGAAVFAATRRLRAVPWGLVVKVDVAEALAVHEQRMRAQARTGIVLGLALSALGVALLRWRNAEQEARLNAVRARTALLLDQANDAILFVGPDGLIRDANRRARDFYGGDLVGRRVWDLRPEKEELSTRARLEQAAATGVRFETVHLRSDGTRVPVEVSARAVTLDGETTLVSVIRDLSERKQAEAQLLQARKMEALGRLAGGIAHDFNNLLGVILGCGELLARKTAGAQRANVDRILEAATRGAALTRRLLAFGRKQMVDPRVLNLNSLISSQKDMLGSLLGEDVALVIRPGEPLGHVKVDPGHLEQALMNLCLNARDAMSDGGVLRIETRNVDCEAGWQALPSAMPPGPYVMLSVADSGSGIEEWVRERMFEPFFTTKEAGKGTGLGLSTVLGSVEQAGGYIRVHSELGAGTTFEIYLPRVDEPAETAREPQDVAPQRRSETVLLVEDEPALRAVTQAFLEEGGYRVLEASGGEEAVAIARRHSGPIHLLLTDVVMPAMSGQALARTLSAVRPQMRVLYMTGHSDDVVDRHGPLERGTLVVAKPFTQLALLQRVQEALGSPIELARP